MIPGLALGRVVHYLPSKECDDTTDLSDANYELLPLVQGRIARVDDLAAGIVTLALDIPPPASPTKGFGRAFTYFATRRAYDESGATPGTWRFPPRV